MLHRSTLNGVKPQASDLIGINSPEFLMDVQYDPARGYPTRLCVDPDARVSDDEFGFVITDFKVLSKGVPQNERRSSEVLIRPQASASLAVSPVACKSKYATVVEEACPLEFGHAR
jgi:hypothetical protein